MSRDGIIREFSGHTYTFLSKDSQTIYKYFSYRVSDGWIVMCDTNTTNGCSNTNKLFIPDELYEIFTADIALQQLSE